jgi:hypothetical protein
MVRESDVMAVAGLKTRIGLGEVNCGWNLDCNQVASVLMIDPNQMMVPGCTNCFNRYQRYQTFGICG